MFKKENGYTQVLATCMRKLMWLIKCMVSNILIQQKKMKNKICSVYYYIIIIIYLSVFFSVFANSFNLCKTNCSILQWSKHGSWYLIIDQFTLCQPIHTNDIINYDKNLLKYYKNGIMCFLPDLILHWHLVHYNCFSFWWALNFWDSNKL